MNVILLLIYAPIIILLLQPMPIDALWYGELVLFALWAANELRATKTRVTLLVQDVESHL